MPATDDYANFTHSPASDVRKATPITPNDGADLVKVTLGVRCNGAGNIACIFADDTITVTLALNAAQDYGYRLSRILNTNTTATGIHGLY